MTRGTRFTLVAVVVALALPAWLAGQARPGTVAGVRNFTHVDATVGCGGATSPEAMAGLARLGFKAVVNLRLATETGAAIDESKAAAEAARLKYIHLPFNGAEPDPKVLDQFILTVTDPENQPVFVHCGTANRVGAFWLAKRMLVDRWDEARALEEAKAIGLSSEALQKFALDYVAKRRGGR
ncbi:MAG TPA: sulfur transferase domain-containing protein [Vicinamibacterales bacterium]|nr:sulfur transferase domain-containing protein [Vicinamibacterales bacterium]